MTSQSMAHTYSSMFEWDDDERGVFYTLKPDEPEFNFRQMYKEIAREDWRLQQYDYYNSYEYEYNCEYYDQGDYKFCDSEEEPPSETSEDNSAYDYMEESENEENKELMDVNKFMYT